MPTAASIAAPTAARATATAQLATATAPTVIPAATPAPPEPATAIPAVPEPVTATAPLEPPPPPPPAAPLGEALQRFAGNTLLYTRPDRFLMLTDSSKQQLWLTADQRFCGRSNTALSQGGAWSTDGRYLLIECQDDGPDPNAPIELLTSNVLDTATGELRRISASLNSPGVTLDMSAGPWSPTDPRLLIYEESDTSRIWSILDLTTGQTTRLIATDLDTGSTYGAAWSPDGSQVAILGRRAGDQRQGVYLISADGTEVRQFELDDVDAFYRLAGAISWSADGQALFTNRQLNPSQNTYTDQSIRVDLRSGAVMALPDTLANLSNTRWSPDGQWFSLKNYATEDRTIVAWSLYHADGTLARTFSSDPTRSVEDLAWLPDGRLALAVNRVNFGVELVVADLDGQEQVIATRPGAFVHHIAAAPDGALLAIEMAGHIAIFDRQGQTLDEFDGWLWDWRPKE